MISYNSYKLMLESFGGAMPLGLGRPNTIGGPVGSNLHEMPMPVDDEDEFEDEDEDEDMDDEDEDMEDDEMVDDEMMGDEDMEAEAPFPPEDSDEMGGPMGGEDEIGQIIGELDPALLGDEAEAEVPVDDEEVMDGEMGDEEAMMGDEEGLEDMDMAALDDEEGAMLDAEGDEEIENSMMAMMRDMMKSYMSKGCNKYMKKNMDADAEPMESGQDWLSSLATQAGGDVHKKHSSGLREDALFQPADNYYDNEPQPGEVGFSPQGRVGSIGGGYNMSDFDDIPTLGESKEERLPTIREYMEWKAKYRQK